MIKSEKQALYYIYHEEQMYDEWQLIDKETFKAQLQHFLDELKDKNKDRAEKERIRLNRKYYFLDLS